MAEQISLSNPCALAKCPPKIPCSSGNSLTKSDSKSTLHIVDAISIFSLLINTHLKLNRLVFLFFELYQSKYPIL